jgi:hypothetical protein
MAEEHVIVATFTQPMEAQVACERLNVEGIPAYVIDDTASSPITGIFGLARRVVVYVPATDYQRAARILEDTPGQPSVPPKRLTAPAEEEEEDEDLWLCPLCGEPLSVALAECPACGTARPELQPPKREGLAWNRPPRSWSDKLTADAPAETLLGMETNVEVPPLRTLEGDALASRALRAALLTALIPPLYFISFWALWQLLAYDGEFSPLGARKRFLGILLNTLLLVVIMAVCAGLRLRSLN